MVSVIKINMVVLGDKNFDEIDNMRQFCVTKNIQLQLIKNYDLNDRKVDENTYDRPPKCANCNRLRLLSDGTLKPCLHSDIEYKVNLNNIRDSLERAILAKPRKGSFCTSRKIFEIGG